MRSFMVFYQKEVMEQIRTYKTLIIGLVLLLFGIMSPVMAKIMPVIIKNMDLGIEIQFPLPVVTDAYAQFFKNLTQMGLIVIILVFSGMVSFEKSKGTVVLMLTKSLSRKAFVMSKYLAAVSLWSVAYGIAALVCFYYTQLLFPNAGVQNLSVALLCLWLFVDLILAITLLASTLFSNPYMGTFGAFVGWFILLMSAYIPKVRNITPQVLSSWHMALLTGDKSIGAVTWPVLIGILTIVILLVTTCSILKRQEL